MSSENKEVSKQGDNYNFVQLSRGYLKQMRELARKSPLAHEILYYLVENMGRTSNAVIVSYKTLQEVTGTSRNTVYRALSVLQTDNWVQVVKIGTANAYAINANVFWQAGRNQKEYAVFKATVVAAASEQDSNFREKSKHKLKHIPIVDDGERFSVSTKEELPPPDQRDLDLD